jgi:ATP-dependent Clp protease ATP-binding subunit ClpA
VNSQTTDDDKNHWIVGDPALERRFQKVAVRELGVPDTLDILRARKERLERHHNVIIADEAIAASVDLTDRYVNDRRRPDKAIDALDEACAHTQAIAQYPRRAEELIRERMQKLKEAHALPKRSPQKQSERQPQPGDDDWDRMAEKGMDALERFGAGLESMFAGAPVGAPPPPATPPPPPQPAPEPVATLGQLDTELAHLLAAEGIVVRAHDVARVVSAMTGHEVTWEPARA